MKSQKQTTMEKIQVYNLFILDESGSMMDIRDAVMSGFNEIMETIKGAAVQFPNQIHDISFFSFNGLGIKKIHFMESVDRLDRLNEQAYRPNASTPLYDAMGLALLKLKYALSPQETHKVSVTIFTDGYENASKEFNVVNIKNIVADLTKSGWVFQYIGTDHDVSKVAEELNIKRSVSFAKNKEGVKNVFSETKLQLLNLYEEFNDEKIDGKVEK